MGRGEGAGAADLSRKKPLSLTLSRKRARGLTELLAVECFERLAGARLGERGWW